MLPIFSCGDNFPPGLPSCYQSILRIGGKWLDRIPGLFLFRATVWKLAGDKAVEPELKLQAPALTRAPGI